MTDKQIIVDGCDVSGCESFCNGICCKVGFGDDASCKLFSDCNYKQFKRKEQECEELKADLKSLEYTVVLRGMRDIDNAADLFSKQIAKIESENSLLKQTLTEIKEILLFNKKELEECLHNDIDGQILQKISEVEDG